MPDQSHLDQRYFIDEYVYNCPFCNRNNVAYVIVDSFSFDWTTRKPCHGFIVRCSSCSFKSMHLTNKELPTDTIPGYGNERFSFSEESDVGAILDTFIFYSVPTSFFTVDDRIPRILRELLTEAQGCLKSNFLTGASACARKVVYELAVLENASGDSYEDRIKSLKAARKDVDETYFDTLIAIQKLTSKKVHENAGDRWEAKHLRVILRALSEVLHAMYVAPAQHEDRRKALLDLNEEVGVKL